MNAAINLTMAAVLVALGCALTGCVPMNLAQQATDACIAKGGVPIINRWTQGVDDCKFPPQVTK